MRVLFFVTLIFGTTSCTLQPTIPNNKLEIPPKPISNEFYEPATTAPDWIWKFKSLEKEKICLAKNIYFEARGESKKGQIVVGLITINRVKSKRFPQSICENVYKKLYVKRIAKTVAQFSWTIDDISNRPKNKKVWKKMLRLEMLCWMKVVSTILKILPMVLLTITTRQ